MEVDREVAPAQSKKKIDKGESLPEKHDGKRSDKKSDSEDPKPRIVLTFRSEKQGAKSSTMKIVPTEEKPEEISPRRSVRTRTTNKWDSDDDNESLISPKKEKTSDEDMETHNPPKRSTQRRNKEFDNVMANAIARKEKSYNESPAPSRPSRRIKPTAKVLANEELRIGIESQNNTRQEKTVEEGVKTRRQVRGRNTVQDEGIKQESKETAMKEIVVTDGETQNENQVKKLKHLCELGLKAITPEDVVIKDDDDEVVSLQDEPEAIEIYDDDTEENEDEEIDDDTEVISKLLEADAESVSTSDEEYLNGGKPHARPRRMATRRLSEYDTQSSIDDNTPLRRSSRKRRYQPDYIDEVPKLKTRGKKQRSAATSEADAEDGAVGEAAGGDEGSAAACPEGGDSRIVATCHCEAAGTYHAAPAELTEPVFCQAIESIDGVRVGCSHTAARLRDGAYAPLVRSGPRAPFLLACAAHARRLRAHMACAACGLFCSQGKFYQCSSGHLFHLECGLPYHEAAAQAAGTAGAAPGCPHCGVTADRWLPANRDVSAVSLAMRHTNKTIYLPEQRVQCTPAYRGFSTLKPSQVDQGPMIPEDLLPSTPIDPKRLCEKPDLEEDPIDAAETLCEGILAGETMEFLVPKIIAASNLNIALPSLGGGTVLHAAARRGHLAAAHLLHSAGADLNSTAGMKTPLMVAVLALLDKSESKSPKKGKMPSDKDSIETEVVESQEEKEGEKDAVTKGETETDRASDEDLMKVIRYLVAAGCDVNVPGPDGMTALHMAAQHGGERVCDVLLSGVRARVDPRDQGGWTPLVWAAENTHHRTVKYLLNAGADALSYDNEGNSVIHWCALAGASAPLRLLLDAAPRAANAPNRNTDTPLHVAAHQAHYACVIILLARGARTDMRNSEGELPLEVCEGRCRAAIALNMQMSLARSDKLTPALILSNDISRGREPQPVPCVNEVDDTPLPSDFTYVTAHVMPKLIPIDNTLATAQGCSCSEGAGDCASAACECSLLGVRRWWARGRLAAGFPYHDPPMLFDCNATCGCNAKKCTNSVLTRLCATGSVFARVCVFRKGGGAGAGGGGGGVGWGLRAEARVPRGAPVAVYVGELLAAADADARPNDQYMFAMDVKPDLLEQCAEKTLLCVDAASYGGAARFINHSCRPNLAPVRAFTHSRDLRLPLIALFANCDISAGDELTFDYGDKFWSVKSRWMRCECGEDDCRYANPTETEA